MRAEEVASSLLTPLGSRWSHTRAVAARAMELVSTVGVEDRELLIASAWLHDVGYSPELRGTGLHQLDGARYLSTTGHPARLCALVAHHSAAMFEARERGLEAELSRWPREESAVSDALWTADMTTGPSGQSVEYAERLEEILDRYGEDSPVASAMVLARPAVEAALRRTEARLRH